METLADAGILAPFGSSYLHLGNLKAFADGALGSETAGGHPFPAIPCTVCRKPLDLTVDLFADENGQAVDEHC